MTIERIDYIDHGVAGEYGFFGKKVASSDVRGMTGTEIGAEIREMTALLGDHVVAVEVETVGAA